MSVVLPWVGNRRPRGSFTPCTETPGPTVADTIAPTVADTPGTWECETLTNFLVAKTMPWQSAKKVCSDDVATEQSTRCFLIENDVNVKTSWPLSLLVFVLSFRWVARCPCVLCPPPSKPSGPTAADTIAPTATNTPGTSGSYTARIAVGFAEELSMSAGQGRDYCAFWVLLTVTSGV